MITAQIFNKFSEVLVDKIVTLVKMYRDGIDNFTPYFLWRKSGYIITRIYECVHDRVFKKIDTKEGNICFE